MPKSKWLRHKKVLWPHLSYSFRQKNAQIAESNFEKSQNLQAFGYLSNFKFLRFMCDKFDAKSGWFCEIFLLKGFITTGKMW